MCLQSNKSIYSQLDVAKWSNVIEKLEKLFKRQIKLLANILSWIILVTCRENHSTNLVIRKNDKLNTNCLGQLISYMRNNKWIISNSYSQFFCSSSPDSLSDLFLSLVITKIMSTIFRLMDSSEIDLKNNHLSTSISSEIFLF